MSSKSVRFFSWPVALLCTVFLVVMLILVNGEPWGAAAFYRQFPGQVIPDMLFSYPPSSLAGLFQAMGESGRQAYLLLDNVDMVFPLAYSLAYFCLLGTALRYLAGQKSPWTALAFAGLLGGLFDYCENFCFRVFAVDPVSDHGALAGIVSVLTPAKFIACSMAMLAVLVVLILALIKRLRSVSRR